MKRTEPKLIGNVIEEMIRACGQEDNFEKQRVCSLWAEVAGAAINRYTTRRYVDGSVLHVYISSASLKNELSFLRDTLVRQLNEAMGKDTVSAIIIH